MTYDTISNVSPEIKDTATKRKSVNNADLIGRRFGRRVVIGLTRHANGNNACLCVCDCGAQAVVVRYVLLAGKSQSCPECNKLVDLSGQRFNRLLVTGRAPNTKEGSARWVCLCDCGQETIVPARSLRSGDSQSCGCLQREIATKHGMYGTPTYRSWRSMIGRCTNHKDPAYMRYHGRGITVCDRWRFGEGGQDGFTCFLNDLGLRPSGMSIERKDNDKGYSPDNCHWATSIEQNNNRRDTPQIFYRNRVQTLAQWARELKINYAVLVWRINRGWPLDRAFTQAVRKCQRSGKP